MGSREKGLQLDHDGRVRCRLSLFLATSIKGVTVCSFVLWSALCGAQAESPRAVLLLDQSDPNAPWGIEFRAAFRSVLSDQKQPVPLYIELADLGRFQNAEYEHL